FRKENVDSAHEQRSARRANNRREKNGWPRVLRIGRRQRRKEQGHFSPFSCSIYAWHEKGKLGGKNRNHHQDFHDRDDTARRVTWQCFIHAFRVMRNTMSAFDPGLLSARFWPVEPALRFSRGSCLLVVRWFIVLDRAWLGESAG